MAPQRAPASFLPTHEPLTQFDEHRTQPGIARFDQPGVGLPLSAAGIAGRDAAKPGQLLACVETVELTNLRSNRDGRHQTDGIEREQLLNHGVARCTFLEPLLDRFDQLGKMA